MGRFFYSRFTRLDIFNVKYGLFVFAMFLAFINPVHAETIPATSGYKTNTTQVAPSRTATGATIADTCQNAWTLIQAQFQAVWEYSEYRGVYQTNYCGFATNSIGDTVAFTTTVSSAYVCPSGYDLSDSQCTREDCVLPLTRQLDGTCATPPCDDGSQRGSDGQCCGYAGTDMQWCSVTSAQDTNCQGATAKGCGVRCAKVTFAGCAPNSVCLFPRLALGELCKTNGLAGMSPGTNGPLSDEEIVDIKKAVATPTEAKTPAGCLASGQSYFTSGTGVTTCIGASPSTPVVSTTKQTETVKTTDANGVESTGTTETTKQTVDDGTAQGTSIQTVKKDAAGNVTESKTTTTESPKELTECQKNPDLLSCAKLGTVDAPADSDPLPTQEVGPNMISMVAMTGNNSCPAPIALPKGMFLSWMPICDAAGWLKPLILAFAWLAAGYFVIGSKME
jgi:hypothetical protein